MAKTVELNSNTRLLLERPDLIGAAAAGIIDVQFIQKSIPGIISGQKSAATVFDMIEETAFDGARQQLSSQTYIDVLSNRTPIIGQACHFILTDRDMYAEETNYVFGLTIPTWQVSIQSVARFIRATDDKKLQAKLVRQIARHEFAHMSGLNQSKDYKNPDMRGGIYTGHCANLCTMQQVMNVNEVISQVNALNDAQLSGFCGSCAVTLAHKSAQE